MKKILALLVVVVVLPSLTGCGCCRRLRDRLCRGAYCGAVAAPLVAPPVMATSPIACDPGCGYGGGIVDAGCGYSPGIQTYGYGGGLPFDSGCTSCSGGYELPSYGFNGGYSDPGYSSGSGTSTIDPGPAPTN